MTQTRMSDLIDANIEDDRWTQIDLVALAETAARATLACVGLDAARCEITLLGCDDHRIATLNGEFRDKPAPTNVLSWPGHEYCVDLPGERPRMANDIGPESVLELGDIAISFDTCEREAQAADKPLSAHVTHLLVHGVLHLLGYDHISDPDAGLMERTEVEILASLGLDDPYSVN